MHVDRDPLEAAYWNAVRNKAKAAHEGESAAIKAASLQLDAVINRFPDENREAVRANARRHVNELTWKLRQRDVLSQPSEAQRQQTMSEEQKAEEFFRAIALEEKEKLRRKR